MKLRVLYLMPIALVALNAHAAIWYVDPRSPGEVRDGSTWETAYRSIQVAINAAAEGPDEQDEIRVADGVYTEQLTMQEGISLYGGFPGVQFSKARKLGARNPLIYKTIIDGENKRQCVFGANDSVLDGFVITGGKGNPSAGGGGMANVAASPVVNNCIFYGNTSGFGGAVANTFGSPKFMNCIFYGNTALYGSAIYNFYSSAQILHCTVSENTASDGSPNPTAILNASSSTIIVNSILWDDSLREILSDSDSEEIVVYNVIHGQDEEYSGFGNLHNDPQFFDPANGDFRLAPTSPCIDSAPSDPVPTIDLPATDLRGLLRPVGFARDFGALEFLAFDESDLDVDDIRDVIEGIGDPDDDGIPNYLDEDSDGDAVTDLAEGPGDLDADGIANYLDDDADGNGVSDITEGTGDGDSDGIPDAIDIDNDGDGLPDMGEGILDVDGDSIPNYIDTDSDGDGILDRIETARDHDGDGLSNYLDKDSDNNGVLDSVEGTDDQDDDNIPDYIDSNDLQRRLTPDINNDGNVDAIDVQFVVNLALGIQP
jgi:hypothetical protein